MTNQAIKMLEMALILLICIENTYTCSAVSTTGASDNVGCDRPGTFPPNLNRRSIFYFVVVSLDLFSKKSKYFKCLNEFESVVTQKILFFTLRHLNKLRVNDADNTLLSSTERMRTIYWKKCSVMDLTLVSCDDTRKKTGPTLNCQN